MLLYHFDNQSERKDMDIESIVAQLKQEISPYSQKSRA